MGLMVALGSEAEPASRISLDSEVVDCEAIGRYEKSSPKPSVGWKSSSLRVPESGERGPFGDVGEITPALLSCFKGWKPAVMRALSGMLASEARLINLPVTRPCFCLNFCSQLLVRVPSKPS